MERTMSDMLSLGWDRRVSIVVFGAESVGKTSMLSQYCCGALEAKIAAEKIFRKVHHVADKACAVEFYEHRLDTLLTGEGPQFSVATNYLEAADAIVFAYAVDLRTSFEALTDIHPRFLSSVDHPHLREVPVALVATKADSTDCHVTETEGRALANNYGWDFMTVSAKEDPANTNQLSNLLGHVVETRKEVLARLRANPPPPEEIPQAETEFDCIIWPTDGLEADDLFNLLKSWKPGKREIYYSWTEAFGYSFFELRLTYEQLLVLHGRPDVEGMNPAECGMSISGSSEGFSEPSDEIDR